MNPSDQNQSLSPAKAIAYILGGVGIGVLIILIFAGWWSTTDGHSGFYGFNPRGMVNLR